MSQRSILSQQPAVKRSHWTEDDIIKHHNASKSESRLKDDDDVVETIENIIDKSDESVLAKLEREAKVCMRQSWTVYYMNLRRQVFQID